MPLDGISGDVIGGLARFLARIFTDVVVEILIRGTGRLLLGLLHPRHEPGDGACAIAGLAFWIVLVVGGIALHGHFAASPRPSSYHVHDSFAFVFHADRLPAPRHRRP